MKPYNVGVFPCGSEVGLEVNRALKYYRHFNLIGLSSVLDHGAVAYPNYYGNLPLLKEKDFLPKLKGLIKKLNLKFIIPAMDEVGYLLKQHEADLDCEVVYPDFETATIIRKKSVTYSFLEDSVQTPKHYVFNEILESDLPVFVKPDIGYGSRGAKLIKTKKELNEYEGSIEEYVYCENLPGKEFTIDCFSNQKNEVLFSGARERQRIRMGISVATKTVEHQSRFNLIAKKISTKLNMSGAWFFQLKEDSNGELKLLEVGGRVSGSMALFRGIGVNFIAADLFQRLGNQVSFPKLQEQEVVLERSFDCKLVMSLNFTTVYCDLDDCLIVNNKINTPLVAFLYQCVNQHKKIVLITRHERIPEQTLRAFKLFNLFDEIIHVQDKNTPKSSYIEATESIFIDDSYKEREEVSAHCHIPTFAPDAVELLLR